ncbi:hypothetical protein G9A89_010281, partial [Geosiphon pyriformis]
AIPYFFKEIANSWYQSLATRSQTFQQFKTVFLRYFSNNNSINRLTNTFTTIKQNNTEAVTTYLGYFHRVLCQIQAINTMYFTELQIFNQFICSLHSSILQHVCSLHPVNLQATVTHARDFESAKLEANHAQAVNLVMNRLSDLNSKLKQISDTINQKIERYLANNHQFIYQSLQRCSNQGNYNCSQNQVCLSTLANQLWQPEMCICHNYAKSKHLPVNDTAANLSSTSILDPSLSTTATSNILTVAICNISTAATSNLSTLNHSNTTPKLTLTWNPKTENNTTKLEIGNGCPPTDPQFFQLIIRIAFSEFRYWCHLKPKFPELFKSPATQKPTQFKNLPAMVTKNKTLVAIFSFEFEETTPVPLFNEAALEEKLITAMYTDAKVDGHFIKLILNSVDCAASACIITADKMTKTPIGEIDDFLFEINGIIIPIKVLLLKTHTTLNWTTQKLQLTFVTCGHFKPSNTQPLIEFKEETRKPTWKAYQVLWANQDHNELPPVPSWNGNETKNDYNKPTNWKWEKEDNGKGKGKETTLEETTSTSEITSGWTSSYSVYKPLPQLPYIPLKCKDCEKKLSSIRAWIMPDEDHWMRTHYYCKPCHRECYGYPKKQDKWDNEPCLTCSEQLLNERIWNDIPVEGATPNEILEIKNNPPELVNIIRIPNPDTFMDKETGPKDFYKYYQNLAPTREEQEQHLEQLNT